MVCLDDPGANGRLHVRAYTNGLANAPPLGWVPAADVGPSEAPSQSVWAGSQGDAPPAEFASREDFIQAVAVATRSVDPGSATVSVTVAQAILESNWANRC
jgi:hypothetical protein